MKANIRGTEIYYDIAGMQIAPHKNDFIEKPVLFLLHGGPGGNHLRYKQHSLELQDVAQLVFIDHRGCGLSKKTKAADYTLENNVEDIEALRKHLGLEKICILGTSYGGMVAQGYATRYPKHVEKLILAVTAPSSQFLDEAKKYLQQYGNKKQIAIAKHLWDGSFKNYQHVAQFFKLMDPMYSVTAAKKRQAVFSKLKSPWSHEALNKGFGGFMRKFNFIPKLKKITCPTLILAGEDDWICRPNQAKQIAENIPHSQLKIFKNCGHAVAIDAHEKYIHLIKKFLQTQNKKSRKGK
ncbi:MAG: hypothetical protein ACD_46C00003G0001 [uncultured bacterium]|nr:MAG: hypothetical protein ACD_46C00003G0001 [uncultured bacterium]